MKATPLLIIFLFTQLSILSAREHPRANVGVGFGLLKMGDQWIKTYSISVNHDFLLSKKSVLTFGVMLEKYAMKMEFDVDTNYLPVYGDYKNSWRYYDLSYSAVYLYLTTNYKYFTGNSKTNRFYLQFGLNVNIEIVQNTEFSYYYRSYRDNVLHPGPYKHDSNDKPDMKERALNFLRGGIGIGFLKKIGTNYAIDTDLYVSHAVRLDTYHKAAAIFPRIRVGFAF